MNKTNRARQMLRSWITQTRPGGLVAHVSWLMEAAGVSAGTALRVLREAIDAGWIRSTRGPDGGYWRT